MLAGEVPDALLGVDADEVAHLSGVALRIAGQLLEQEDTDVLPTEETGVDAYELVVVEVEDETVGAVLPVLVKVFLERVGMLGPAPLEPVHRLQVVRLTADVDDDLGLAEQVAEPLGDDTAVGVIGQGEELERDD